MMRFLGWVELEEEKNTSVYISNLPFGITEESFVVSSLCITNIVFSF